MRNAEIGMRNNAQRQWWASSAPLCILGKMFVRLYRTTFCV